MSNMTEDRFDPDPELDRLLAAAAPSTTEATWKVRSLLASMAALSVAESVATRRRRMRIAAGVAVPLVLVGGAGAAYASTAIDWSAFFGHTTSRADGTQDPNGTTTSDGMQNSDGSVRFTLPSGATCELRFALVANQATGATQADPAVVAQTQHSLRTYLAGGTVLADANIDAVLAENRSDQNWVLKDGATPVPFGPGTSNDNADVDYHGAAIEGISKAIWAHVPGTTAAGVLLTSQVNCDAGAGQ